MIYLVAFICFGNTAEDNLDSRAFTQFVLVLSFAGVIASVIFHMLVKERPQNHEIKDSGCSKDYEPEIADMSKLNRDPISTKKKLEWLKDLKFYVVIMLYAISRTFYTLCLTYLIFYVQYTLMLQKVYIAVVPLAMVLSGLIVSKPIKQIIDFIGLEKSFILFCFIGVMTCVWICFGCYTPESKKYEIFGISAFLGISSYSMMVISLSLVVVFIGKNIGS